MWGNIVDCTRIDALFYFVEVLSLQRVWRTCVGMCGGHRQGRSLMTTLIVRRRGATTLHFHDSHVS
jgi:hypothetical protein